MNRLSAAPHQTANGAPLHAGRILQRKCDCGNHTVAGGECAECGKKKVSLQRATHHFELESEDAGGVPPVVHEVLRSSGQPLDEQTRAFMEKRFNHDFSQVRVHSDVKAAESAQAVNSLAYTVGHNIVFGAHQYAPSTGQGRRLLAHELTHTLQQSSTPASLMNALRIGPPDDVHEHEAETQAARIVESGENGPAPLRAFASTPSLQRAPKDPTPTKPAQPPQPTRPKSPSCMEVINIREYSRGNDDKVECQYETARITVKLLVDTCACPADMPLKLNYDVLMEGKSFSLPEKEEKGEKEELETQASEEVAGRGTDAEGNPVPAIGLRETGKGNSAPLIHRAGGAKGDPGDTLQGELNLSKSVPCKGGSAKGSVEVGTSQTITWSIKTIDKGRVFWVDEASIGMTEHPPSRRLPTPTVDVTGGVNKPYPPFPGLTRHPQCTCNPRTGWHEGKKCPPAFTEGTIQTGQ